MSLETVLLLFLPVGTLSMANHVRDGESIVIMAAVSVGIVIVIIACAVDFILTVSIFSCSFLEI